VRSWIAKSSMLLDKYVRRREDMDLRQGNVFQRLGSVKRRWSPEREASQGRYTQRTEEETGLHRISATATNVTHGQHRRHMVWKRLDITGATTQGKGMRQGCQAHENDIQKDEQEADRASECAGEPMVTVGTVLCRADVGLLAVSGPTMDALGGQQGAVVTESAVQNTDDGMRPGVASQDGHDADRAKEAQGASIEDRRIMLLGGQGASTFRMGQRIGAGS
jgi:hypothetical protein